MKNFNRNLALSMAVVSMIPAATAPVSAIGMDTMTLKSKGEATPYTMSALTGANRYETAAKLAASKNKDTVILVNTDKSLADGLSASGLAGTLNAPILLVKNNKIPKETKAAIRNTKHAIIIGGKNAISKNVEKEINSLGIKTERIEGEDRIVTSLNVAYEVQKRVGEKAVYYVNGYKGEADAMSIAPVAAKTKGAVILTNGKNVPIPASIETPTYAIGGKSVMSDDLVKEGDATRIGGKDRYETNRLIINRFFANDKDFYVAKGDLLVDALTTSAMGKPVMLVSERSDKSLIGRADNVTAVGGLSNRILSQIRDILDLTHNTNIPDVSPDDNNPILPDNPIIPDGGDSNKPVIPDTKPTEPVKPGHVHTWVHHDAVVKKELIIPAWDEKVLSEKDHIICNGCGKDFGVYSDANANKWHSHPCKTDGWKLMPIVEKVIHHPAVYEDKVVTPAYDECSGCGARR